MRTPPVPPTPPVSSSNPARTTARRSVLNVVGKDYSIPKAKFYRLEPAPEEITNRERDVLKLIVDEYTTQEIADLLHLSKRTVGTHRQNLLYKIGARNTVGLVKYALRHGIIS